MHPFLLQISPVSHRNCFSSCPFSRAASASPDAQSQQFCQQHAHICVTGKIIDVSVHQGDIDWAKVKSDSVEFAVLRAGYGREAAPRRHNKFNASFTRRTNRRNIFRRNRSFVRRQQSFVQIASICNNDTTNISCHFSELLKA